MTPKSWDSPAFPVVKEPSIGWFAVRVRAAAEQTAARQIQALGFELLAPTYKTRRRWSDRMKEVHAPLLPGYVLCYMNPVERLPVLKCSSVIEVVSAGRLPLEIDRNEVESIRRVVDAQQKAEPVPYLSKGQWIELDRGPLKGLTGILVEQSEENAGLVVSVTMLQRSIRVTIDEAWIDPRCYRTLAPARVA